MRSEKHFRLVTLGGLALLTSSGETETVVAIRPRHLFVLVVVAMSRRPVRREALAALFWGDEPEGNARHSLSNALSALRSALGSDSLSANRDEVALALSVRLAVDALELTAAVEARDHERVAELYAGPFLGGSAPASAAFEQWVDRERARLERAFLSAAEHAAPALLRRREWERAAQLGERWLHAAPNSTVAFTTLLRARSGAGTAAAYRAALGDYERMRRWLAAEHDAEPAPAVTALATELRESLSLAEAAGAKTVERAAPAATPVLPDAAPSESAPSLAEAGSAAAPFAAPTVERAVESPSAAELAGPFQRRRRLLDRRWTRRAAAVGLVALAAVAGISGTARWLSGARNGSASTRPIIAIVDVENVRGDTALTWLRDGMPELIADELGRASTLDVVAPARVREVAARSGADSATHLDQSQVIELAQTVGATLAASAGLTRGNGMYVLDVSVRDASNGAPVQSFSVHAADPVQLGHLAAARLLDVVSAVPSGASAPPRLAALTTVSPDAYRSFVLGARDFEEGRLGRAARELDAAIAADSGFVQAIRGRRDLARMDDDQPLARELDSLIVRHADRESDWDRTVDETYRALYGAEVQRSEALAAGLVARYPRDPRAYTVDVDVLTTHGRWRAADSVLQRQLALDSLAMAAGDGPCAPCNAYSGLVALRLASGDAAGAEAAARRWVALQPNTPGAWEKLAEALEVSARTAEAIEARRRALLLSPAPEYGVAYARTLVIAGRFDEADSVARALERGGGPLGRSGAVDIETMVARERGQFRRASELLAAADTSTGLELVEADNLVRLGRLAEARRIYERNGHASWAGMPADAQMARAFTWAHALEAEALWRVGDTAAFRVIADSVRIGAPRSYYGRDWVLSHDMAGFIALGRGDLAGAERELQAGRWGVAGWTRTNVELAKVQLARGETAAAIATIRDAYRGPLDAMARYVPRSELDYWMSIAFARAGRPDSAAAYAARVRAAWSDADPAVRKLLATLPPSGR